MDNPDFCNEVKKLSQEISKMELSSLGKWEWFKFKSKESAIKISKYATKLKKQKQQLIIREINSLCHKADLSVEEHIRLNCLQTELDNLYLDKANGAFVRSRARWLEEGKKIPPTSLTWKNKDRLIRKSKCYSLMILTLMIKT